MNTIADTSIQSVAVQRCREALHHDPHTAVPNDANDLVASEPAKHVWIIRRI